MTISYNWLSEYLPETIEPEKLSKILTSIGLEVESLELFETIKGGLKGLVIGEVIACEKHPDADKLSVTNVKVGASETLQIVCGAPNVATGQKVIVATIGATIYPVSGEPLTMKKAKIRGVESQGMICAEDEIGIGESHVGIMILPSSTIVGTPAADYFSPYIDWVYEIGLTPNRMDAMSHLGVARDVCAYLTHHNNEHCVVKSPVKGTGFKADNPTALKISVEIENKNACQRYAGVSIKGVTIKESPAWLQNKLKAIGLRPINNVVDITNFILHETGQPLHAFDADYIKGNKVIVKNLPEGTLFTTLDEKQRKLSADDLMICNGDGIGMCIGGVFGGVTSGVTPATTNIFLESAWFNPTTIRKTSFRHGLRTDAATRFEKGVDISNTVNVLKRAILMIKEIAGGEISSEIVDVYPAPKEKTQVALKFHYLKKLSGKNYHPDSVKQILVALGFTFIKEGTNDLWFDVPFSKPDVTLPADIVEEIMRIDGLDNVEIPAGITMAPSPDTLSFEEATREKISHLLVATGFSEIFTNSITNSKYYGETILQSTVKMLNNLSADLDVLRPSMLETGLEVVSHNLNRRSASLNLFEFGKTYSITEPGKYAEQMHCTLYATGVLTSGHWKNKPIKVDFFYLKGVIEKILTAIGLQVDKAEALETESLQGQELTVSRQPIIKIGMVPAKKAASFDVKQPVYYADINWTALIAAAKKKKVEFKEISKFPVVERDLALVVNKSVKFEQIQEVTKRAKAGKLTGMQLFDVFESDKLGEDKKSMAVNFTFQDSEKTMTDQDIDGMMQKLVKVYEEELGAEIRK
ncbi:MAG: phenylalanine--tRNA ligase subunit beta [Bacteroidota bacterium]